MLEYPQENRKDMIILSLINVADEIQDFKHKLTVLDIDDIEKSLKKIQSLVKEKKRPPKKPFELSV